MQDKSHGKNRPESQPVVKMPQSRAAAAEPATGPTRKFRLPTLSPGREKKVGIGVIVGLILVFAFVLYKRISAPSPVAEAPSETQGGTAVGPEGHAHSGANPDQPTVVSASETSSEAPRHAHRSASEDRWGGSSRRVKDNDPAAAIARSPLLPVNPTDERPKSRFNRPGQENAPARAVSRYDRDPRAAVVRVDSQSDDEIPDAEIPNAKAGEPESEPAVENRFGFPARTAAPASDVVADDPFRRAPPGFPTHRAEVDEAVSDDHLETEVLPSQLKSARSARLQPSPPSDPRDPAQVLNNSRANVLEGSQENPLRTRMSGSSRFDAAAVATANDDAAQDEPSTLPNARPVTPPRSRSAVSASVRRDNEPFDETIVADDVRPTTRPVVRNWQDDRVGRAAAPSRRLPEATAIEEPSAASESRANAEDTAQVYIVRRDDNYWTISEQLYGTGAYFKSLYEHNRRLQPRADLFAGQRLQTPSQAVLEKMYPHLCPPPRSAGATATSGRQGSGAGAARPYSVKEGDTLYEIARNELGKAARWAEIYDLNRERLGANFDYLEPGLQLMLPVEDRPADDSSADRVAGSGRAAAER